MLLSSANRHRYAQREHISPFNREYRDDQITLLRAYLARYFIKPLIRGEYVLLITGGRQNRTIADSRTSVLYTQRTLYKYMALARHTGRKVSYAMLYSYGVYAIRYLFIGIAREQSTRPLDNESGVRARAESKVERARRVTTTARGGTSVIAGRGCGRTRSNPRAARSPLRKHT